MAEKNTYKILVIDDDELIRSIYSDRLSQESDFIVDIAVDGSDGLAKIQANTYDLIFSGIQMPNLTGFELFQTLQGNEDWIVIPFVIFSDLGDQEDVQKAYDLGIKHFIVTGETTPNDITQKIRDILIENKELVNTIMGVNAYKILIIEDDELTRRIYTERLAKETSFIIDTAVDGADGFSKIKSNRYDLIFSGIQMPNITGFELFEKLQGNAEWITIPFVIFSHLGRNEDVQKAHDLGIKHFIVRGQTTPNDIVQKIRDILIESEELIISSLTRSHILIVEDNPIIRSTYIDIFQLKSNFIVDSAVDGSDALAKTKQNVYDLIFSGIQMPNMTGFELFEALQEDEKYKKIPMVLFSHLGRDEDIENAHRLGIKHVIVRAEKTPNEIVNKIQDILDIKDKNYNLTISKNSPDYAEFIKSFFGTDCVEYRDMDVIPITITLQQSSKPYIFTIELNCKNPK